MSVVWLSPTTAYHLTADSEPTIGPSGIALATGMRLENIQTGARKVWNGSAWIAETSASIGSIELSSTALAALELIGIKGADGSAIVANANPMPVSDAGGSLTVDGTVAATQSGTWNIATVTTVTGVTTLSTLTTVTNPVGVKGADGSAIAAQANPLPIRLSDGTTYIATLPVSLASVPSHAVTNAGTFAVQVDGNALTSLQLIDDTVFADDVAFTPATSKVSAVGFLADETATDSVDEGDVGAARMTLDRKQHVVNEFESNSIRASGTSMTPKFAVIDHASSGDNTLVAAVASKKIRVLSLYLVAAGAVNVRFESGASGTALSGQMNLAANGGFCLPFNPLGWFETASNTLLNLELSGAVSVDGGLTYCEV